MRKQKIPLLLKIKRFKNSPFILSLNDKLSFLKPPKKFKGIPRSILLIRNDRIGDAVVTLPVIRNIKINYPGIKIDVLVSERNEFVFHGNEYINEVIDLQTKTSNGKIPLIGGLYDFFVNWVIRFFLDKEFRDKIKHLRGKNYDAVIDLVGLKRHLILSNYLTGYSVGPRKFGVYIFYSYYGDSNWVTLHDDDFMTKKIEKLILDAFGFEFKTYETSLPLVNLTESSGNYKYDLILHLGTGSLRKFTTVKEEDLIGQFGNRKILITDTDRDNFNYLKNTFRENNNIEFKLFNTLAEMARFCLNSKILLCYDGGQAHYLSQFIRTAVIFGPGSVSLWKPFEFAEYEILEESSKGETAIISKGKFKHIAFYFPVWCRPCFDVGCDKVVCMSELTVSFIYEVLNKYALNAE